jgi:hypothetical protein
MTTAWIAAASAAIVALISAFLTYNTTRRLSRRNDQITFVGRQLGELYGPLYALSQASSNSWSEFRKKYGADRPYLFTDGVVPSEDDVRAWKYWLPHVFMPLNRRMFDVILARTDLIDGEEMPQCFIDFCAHVTGYEVTMAQWADGDYSTLASVINHPGSSFHRHVEMKYKELKKRQMTLLETSPRVTRQMASWKRRDALAGRHLRDLRVRWRTNRGGSSDRARRGHA